MKKTLEELKAIREKKRDEINLRHGREGFRVVVGMATCGIAAGARPVMVELMNSIEALGLKNVTVAQTGCIGVCRLEPIVEVYNPEGEKVTYVKMTPEKAKRIVQEHLVTGIPVEEYTMNIVDGQVIDPVLKA